MIKGFVWIPANWANWSKTRSENTYRMGEWYSLWGCMGSGVGAEALQWPFPCLHHPFSFCLVNPREKFNKLSKDISFPYQYHITFTLYTHLSPKFKIQIGAPFGCLGVPARREQKFPKRGYLSGSRVERCPDKFSDLFFLSMYLQNHPPSF